MEKRSWLLLCMMSSMVLGIMQQTKAQFNATSPTSFIRTWQGMSPQTNPATFIGLTTKEVKQVTQYFDGLGRPIETVAKEGSMISLGTKYDLVETNIYDVYGRETFKYLPFAANTTANNTSISDGKFKIDPIQEQSNFLSSGNSNSPIAGQAETFFYSKTVYEASPLNRVTTAMAPGNNWVGASVGITTNYLVNTVADSVRLWTLGSSVVDTFVSFSTTNIYGAGLLVKTITKDERGYQVIEYKDKSGLVILKKVQLTAAADLGNGSSQAGWLSTYYIYDEFNQLRVVIQPRGVEYMRVNSWPASASMKNNVDEFCFRYEYDTRNRMILKRVPGASLITMVYDRWDRLVLTQDGRMRAANQWLYTKYDTLNRPVITGLYTNATQTAPSAVQGLVNSFSPQYRAESFTPGASQPQYTLTRTFPSVAASTVLTATYYDNYDWTTNLNTAFKTYVTSYDIGLANDTLASFKDPLAQSFQTNGLITGVWQNTSPATYMSNLYDRKGRLVQVQSKNITNGTDIATTLYSFNGSVLVQALVQNNAVNGQTTEIWTRQDFDDLWRLTRIDKKLKHPQVNGGAFSLWKTVSETKYDAIGQAKTKTLGGTLAINDYQYNIRGWLLNINKDFVSGTITNRFFGMELGYDKPSANKNYGTGLLNGNIKGTVWKSKGDGIQRSYSYTYDAVNRLMTAGYAGVAGEDYSVTMGTTGTDPNTAYDYNGNIKAMTQKGWVNGANATLDNLGYTYKNTNASNRLESVSDVGTTLTAQGDFTDKNTSGVDYDYNESGSITKDLNKNISSITYNHLNLPLVISITNNDVGKTPKGTVTYLYDGMGIKLKKTVFEISTKVLFGVDSISTSITTVTTYLGGSVYESKTYGDLSLASLNYTDRLQFIGFEEGRIRLEQASTATCTAQPVRFIYDYFIKDHLGNTRSVVTEQNEDICFLPATLETATVAAEKKIFSIKDAQIYDKSVVNGAASYPQFSNKLYRAHGGVPNEKTGLAIILKVMAGDVIKFKVQSIYTPPTGGNYGAAPATIALTELLAGFGGSGYPGAKGVSAATVETLNPASTFTTFNNLRTETTTRPKAYLNYLFFDEQFKYSNQGGAAPVNGFTAGSTTPVYSDVTSFFNTPLTATKSGYLYIFVSNESNIQVFFDNLNVTHTPGPILEETHYFPFGLAMSGISSRAMGKLENRFKFNDGSELQSKEFYDGSGLELYETAFRSYDPQIGRFHQIDPLAEISDNWSPFTFANNNPVLLNDPLGLTADSSKLGLTANSAPILAEVVVTAKKKNCQTCSSSNVNAGAPPSTGSAKTPENGNSSSTAKSPARGEDLSNPVDWLYHLNSFNPLANVVNGVWTYFTGHDSYGVNQSNTQGTVQILSAIPINRASSAVTTLGEISYSALQKGILKTLSDPRKMIHLMDPKHKFSLLLERAGSESNVVRRLYLSLAQSGKLPSSGVFSETIVIYGHNVVITGNVIDGIPHIGSAYIPR